MPVRDHLFISYAAENSALADWFARRLAALGYAVWYDRFTLLGGEPWPQDIEVAIDQRTFRMLALISHASKDKKNPTGERKKGEAVGKREDIADFVIPLNVDLATSDVPWDLMGTQYIDFSHSWAKGLAGVLTKLEKLGAPRTLADGASLVHQTVIESTAIRHRQETLVSNCLRIRELPDEIVKCVFENELLKKVDDKIDVVFCVVPDAVFQNCRPESKIVDALGARDGPPVPDSDYQGVDPSAERRKQVR